MWRARPICFIAAELDTCPGPARGRVVEVLYAWLSLLRQCVLDAQALGEIDPHAEVDQVVFEIQAMLLAANFLFVMTNDSLRLTQARPGAAISSAAASGVGNVICRHVDLAILRTTRG